jgi:ferredoxin--NADP+ reductase
MSNHGNLQVAVIGAGPAGLFAAEALAGKGFGVALFNRDIKPGGLAEYGIFPDKLKLKNGLRNQFRTILQSENIVYLGNIHVSVDSCLAVQTLFEWGFNVILITCGTQGTKSLNLPGEKLEGVIHAKDLVYHYNRLPPFASRNYKFGRHVAIVGGGNVMADVAHFLIKYTAVEEITAIIRRGPAEVKFDKKEMVPIIAYLDQVEFDKEMDRVSDEMRKIGQEPQAAIESILAAAPVACPKEREARLCFRFLSSPRQILMDETEQKVIGIDLEENQLLMADDEVKARGTGKAVNFLCDNVIFAIGDRVLDELGLPMNKSEFSKARSPLFPINGQTFEIEDPGSGQNIQGIFIAGWLRNPSTGLVGTARKDGVYAAEAVGQYLAQIKELGGIDRDQLVQRLRHQGCVVVTKDLLPVLQEEEKIQAEKAGLEEYKFLTNEEMLRILGLN